jgi:translation initiation factor 2B subunit (eIF-2B alpha/beta/delta family)
MLCGADGISFQGWMINGTPSLELAQMALRRGRPFYAVCTISKIDARGLTAGWREADPGFNLLPLELLSGLVTERGILQPEDIYKFTIEDIIGSTGERPR